MSIPKTLSSKKKSQAVFKTREEWLINATIELTPFIKKQANLTPSSFPIHFSCGFPLGTRKAIGQCFSDTVAKDGYFNIFINPILDDPLAVVPVLIHELCHVFAGVEAGHRTPFKRVATLLGLTGKMTTITATPELLDLIKSLNLPPYPHGSVVPSPKKQGTRLIKAMCPDCGYTIRITSKWIEEIGLPLCPNEDHEENIELQEAPPKRRL